MAAFGLPVAVSQPYSFIHHPRGLAHIGARGTAWYNVAMLDRLFDFEEVRVASKRPESRERFAAEMSARLKKKVVVAESREAAVRDADIIIDA